ncbi:MAG TPA: hypothetical protein VFL99_06820 [Segeticoccus sp.]|uniref:hypothetical protein n=1 Tax=Segeticoccus sp. TaxID=2706531 RepID=UPI002D807BBC|nr:hypothetical protein [Segeticoccus sp.]HET8600021.1 hypothetical protein [Segeticoccus sp.]
MTKPTRRQRPTTSPFYVHGQEPEQERFEKGDRVTHDRYGLGRVTSLQGDGAVCVDFGEGSVHLSLDHPGLHRL